MAADPALLLLTLLCALLVTPPLPPCAAMHIHHSQHLELTSDVSLSDAPCKLKCANLIKKQAEMYAKAETENNKKDPKTGKTRIDIIMEREAEAGTVSTDTPSKLKVDVHTHKSSNNKDM